MNKVLVFDMDGTLCDFYGVEGWLNCLMAEDVRPYVEARPFYDMFAMMEGQQRTPQRNMTRQLDRQNWNGLKNSVSLTMNCT